LYREKDLIILVAIILKDAYKDVVEKGMQSFAFAAYNFNKL